MPEPVTIFITRRAKPGKEAELEAWARDVRDIAEKFPGHMGCRSLEAVSGHAAGEFEVVFTFDSVENLRRWDESTERRELYARLEPLIDDQKIRHLTGLEPWLNLATPQLGDPPPRWKLFLLGFLGVYPTINIVFFVLGPLVHELPTWQRLLCTVPVISALMTFVVMPALSRLLRGWLYPKD